MLIQDSMVVSLMAMDEKPMKNPEDKQHEEGRLNNLPDHGDDDEVAPGRDFERVGVRGFSLFNPVLGGVPDPAFEGCGMLM